MAPPYIPRTLIKNAGTEGAQTIKEADILDIAEPIVILGDPGLGKTELTKKIALALDSNRIPGGTFYRTSNVERLIKPGTSRVIVDGLDEIASSSGVVAVDEVLRKLSQLGNPNFIISCRSADWQGSTDRYKIRSDYGSDPVTLLLQPFSRNEASTFLSGYGAALDAEQILSHLSSRDLDELYGNPLTLNLIGALAQEGRGLPNSRAELFGKACELLTTEVNEAHLKDENAQANREKLLLSAGTLFAHLILSGSTGIADMPPGSAPQGYVPISEFSDIADAPLAAASIRTQLFQSAGENLFVPFHRVIAEFLGARWLSHSSSEKNLSRRRVFQGLTFAGGVPTSFRGLHAWLAYFNPAVADECIKNDPYGVLRYGEPDQFPDSRAKLLLHSLAALVKDDPYFRSEDWGARSITGLARPKLKSEIVSLIKNKNNHYHLSSLILQALPGSSLAHTIAPQLVSITKNDRAAYVERINAAQALIASDAKIKWRDVARAVMRKSSEGARLAMEIVAQLKGKGFSGADIAEVVFEFQGIFSDGRDRVRVGGVDYLLVRSLDAPTIIDTLNNMAARIVAAKAPRHWNPGSDFASSVHRLISHLIEQGGTPKPKDLWTWLKMLEGSRGYANSDREQIAEFLRSNTALRRSIQRIAFSDRAVESTWMAIVHDLPMASLGLALSIDDAVDYLREIGLKERLSNFDVSLWASIVRAQIRREGFQAEINTAINLGMERHAQLREQFKEITKPPARDWEKEDAERQAAYESELQQRFASQRLTFQPHRAAIEQGQHFGALFTMASGYLKRYYDLDNDASPDERLQRWLGADLADAALAGFANYLFRQDLPTSAQIAQTHAEGKHFNAESVMTCGLLERVRHSQPLADLPEGVVAAVLASWLEFSDYNSNQFGEEARRRMEAVVFRTDADAEKFFDTVIEPHLRANRSHVPGLYVLGNDARFKGFAGSLAVKWLRLFPDALPSTQERLLEIALRNPERDELVALIQLRRQSIGTVPPEVQGLWMAVAFVSDFENNQQQLRTFFEGDPSTIWILRAFFRTKTPEDSEWMAASLAQCAFILETFARKWPVAGYPIGVFHGDTNPWDASDFLRSCINAIAAQPTEDASARLNELAKSLADTSYSDSLKHARAQQRRLRRDVEFRVPSFAEIKRTLSQGLPAGIDDLKAMLLDGLDEAQKYIRDSDTQTWSAFYSSGDPLPENDCRNRLLDLLRPRLPDQIMLLPETVMPEMRRADIVSIFGQLGLPTEIKGQWHPEVWNASSVQLIENYARDWRAFGRGVYLVLWFGNVTKKKLTKHPNGLPPPKTPADLRLMLEDQLTEAERLRIDVVVLDLSRPTQPVKTGKGKSRRAKIARKKSSKLKRRR